MIPGRSAGLEFHRRSDLPAAILAKEPDILFAHNFCNADFHEVLDPTCNPMPVSAARASKAFLYCCFHPTILLQGSHKRQRRPSSAFNG